MTELFVTQTNHSKTQFPTNSQKVKLQSDIENHLDKKEHLEILVNILNNMETIIYNTMSDLTVFDLNDLPPKSFWELHEYVELALKNKKRATEMHKYSTEHSDTISVLNKKLQLSDAQKQKSQDICIEQSGYDKLRNDAITSNGYIKNFMNVKPGYS